VIFKPRQSFLASCAKKLATGGQFYLCFQIDPKFVPLVLITYEATSWVTRKLHYFGFLFFISTHFPFAVFSHSSKDNPTYTNSCGLSLWRHGVSIKKIMCQIYNIIFIQKFIIYPYIINLLRILYIYIYIYI